MAVGAARTEVASCPNQWPTCGLLKFVNNIKNKIKTKREQMARMSVSKIDLLMALCHMRKQTHILQKLKHLWGEVPSFTLRYSAKKKQGGRNAEGDGAAVGAQTEASLRWSPPVNARY